MQRSDQESISRKLFELESRLDRVNQAWTVDDYEALLKFHVRILPTLLHAERGSIFFSDHVARMVWLKFGTNLLEREIEAPFEGSIVGRVIQTGESTVENNMDLKPGFHQVVAARTGFITKSLMCVPIKSLVDNSITGAIQVLNKKDGQLFSNEDLLFLGEIARYLSMIIDNILINKEIVDISFRLSQQVEQINQGLTATNQLIVASQAMRDVVAMARMVSTTPVNVFIQGENGTGKELIARLIHESSDRHNGPFVAVNCASIPENLMESEFFGYEKGAFTGAVGNRKGRFEEAHGGTLFLDEIADMPLYIQPKFLRAIQEREGSRLGANKVFPYDFRIITATNRDLQKKIESGQFREDLFYRLFSVEIHIPPLRDRREEIVPLASAFLQETCTRFNKKIRGFAPEVIRRFEAYHWPGNVRQLRQEVERLVALTPSGDLARLGASSTELQRAGVSESSNGDNDQGLPSQVKSMEIQLIQQALKESGGNKVKASLALGITRQGLHKKMLRYGLIS